MYVFPLILYRLSVLPLSQAHQRSLSKLLLGRQKPMVRRQICCQHLRNEGLGMPDLENHWFAERLAYLGRSLSKALRNIPGPSDLSQPRNELYRELVVGSTSYPFEDRLGWSLEEVRSHWNWAPGSGFLNNSEFSLTWWLARNPLLLLGWYHKAGPADVPDYLRCSSCLKQTAEPAFYYCERVRSFWNHIGEWMARIEPQQLVLLDVGYVIDNFFFTSEPR